MKITEKTWDEYVARLSRLNETAGEKMADYIAKHGTEGTAALTAYAQALIEKYGEGSAELACQMYDAMAEASGADVPPAEPAPVTQYGETAKMVNGTKQSPPLLQSGVSRLVKRAAADTTLHNAIRDGAEWAWVPHGDTCPFCMMLASRGWQQASKKALKGDHAQHIHANCNCEYAIRFDGKTTVAGYDPEKYLAMYNDAGGDINAMRRAQYAQNKDKINAQKRAAYAQRKLLKGNADGILNEGSEGYVPITRESIEAVRPFSCQTLDTEASNALASSQKRLLALAAAHPAGTETARSYGLDMQPLGKTSVGQKPGSVRISNQSVPYILIHNHPDGLTLSPTDILGFVTHDNLRMMTAVGNNGRVYAVEKLPGYDKGMLQELSEKLTVQAQEAKNVEDIVQAVETFFEEVKPYGVRYYATEG